MFDWLSLLQWTGWAGLGSIVVALLTLWLKDRADRRTLTVEQGKLAISARGVDLTAAQVTIQERTAEVAAMELATKTYQGIIAALAAQVDELADRVAALEGREQECLKRLAEVEEGRRRDQAEFWRQRNPGSG